MSCKDDHSAVRHNRLVVPFGYRDAVQISAAIASYWEADATGFPRSIVATGQRMQRDWEVIGPNQTFLGADGDLPGTDNDVHVGQPTIPRQSCYSDKMVANPHKFSISSCTKASLYGSLSACGAPAPVASVRIGCWSRLLRALQAN